MTRARELERVFGEFKENVRDLPVKLFLGAEIYYYPEMIRGLDDGTLLTLDGSKYVLVEFSTRQKTDVADAVYELALAGYRPIVAHAERYDYLRKDDFFAIKENGGLIQINADSVRYSYERRLLKYLLKNDLVDCIASDCHDDVRRKVDFGPVKDYVGRRFPARRRVFPDENVWFA